MANGGVGAFLTLYLSSSECRVPRYELVGKSNYRIAEQ